MPRPDLDGSPQDTREDIESEATQRGFTLEPVYAGRPPSLETVVLDEEEDTCPGITPPRTPTTPPHPLPSAPPPGPALPSEPPTG